MTASKGVAKVTILAPKTAGTFPMTVSYAGSAVYASTSTTASLTVR